MKKWLSLLLAVVMLVLMVSCGGEKVEITRGEIEGKVYKNDVLGFTFTAPESWKYSTDEEVAALVNLSADKIGGENFKNAIKNNVSVYDMMVVDSLTASNVNVGYENLSKSLSTGITVEKYIDALKTQMAQVSGMTVTFPDSYETAKLGETEFTKVVCTTTMQGISMTQVYYVQKVGNYMAFVIVTTPGGYTVAQIEAMFS
jgi:hypothetical protein